MSIRKSSSLHDWLLRLNFKIFTWDLDIGLWIETAVDWVVERVNDVLDLAELAYNWAQGAWDYAQNLFNILNTAVLQLRDNILGAFSTLGSLLSDWWLSRRTLVLGWIDAAYDALRLVISGVERTVNSVSTRLDYFINSILPGLLSLNSFTSWWGHGSSSHDEWWAAAGPSILSEAEARLLPVENQVKQHQSLLDMIKDLFTDPEKWLLDRIEGMLARFL